MTALAHLTDADEIVARSFALVRAAARLDALPAPRRAIAGRIVHATAMAELAALLAWSGDPDAAGRAALAAGRPVLVDARMVAAAITAPPGQSVPPIICTLDEARARPGCTRSAAAVDLWRTHIAGAVVAIGNAPTALFRLLEHLPRWPARPAAILAFPVGFVGATESKAALMAAGLDVPWVTLPGRLGGSAMAAAAVNALLRPPP
jgi:precorrin-8X/cobalt-precorrin-8 methylmutase